MTAFTVFDRLHKGFIVDDNHVTYCEAEAKMFSQADIDTLNATDSARRFMIREFTPINPKHPGCYTLAVGTAHFVEVLEDGYAPRTVIKNSDTHKFLKELGDIVSERELGEHAYFEYRRAHVGERIKFALCTDEQDAFAQALHFARKNLTASGEHSPYLIAAYVTCRREHGLPDSLITPNTEALDSDPNQTLQAPRYQVGDIYSFKSDDDKAYARKKLLRSLITAARYSVRGYAGYGVVKRRNNGKLNETQKSDIRAALAVFDQADKIEVAGIKTSSAYELRCTSPNVLQGGNTFLKYQLLFRATINGMRQCVLI